MSRNRHVDETTKKLPLMGELCGACHSSTGQKASMVGSCLTLEDTDGLVAELMGRSDGVQQDKSGSVHLSHVSIGSLGETSIMGSGLPDVGALLERPR